MTRQRQTRAGAGRPVFSPTRLDLSLRRENKQIDNVPEIGSENVLLVSLLFFIDHLFKCAWRPITDGAANHGRGWLQWDQSDEGTEPSSPSLALAGPRICGGWGGGGPESQPGSVQFSLTGSNLLKG